MEPLETLVETPGGREYALPAELARLYGRLAFPLQPEQPYVIGNFVVTLDGVVTLNIPGKSGGGPISGKNEHDRLVMGLTRAVADAVIVGIGTLRALPRTIWTAEQAHPAQAEAFGALRAQLGKVGPPLNVIVTASGDVDLRLPVCASGAVPVLIATTAAGARRLEAADLPAGVRVRALGEADRLEARAVLGAVLAELAAANIVAEVILTEGGPQLLGDFLNEGCLDELFYTLAPQVAGRPGPRAPGPERLGMVMDQLFAPDRPLWAQLGNLKRGGSHLFMRYVFERTSP